MTGATHDENMRVHSNKPSLIHKAIPYLALLHDLLNVQFQKTSADDICQAIQDHSYSHGQTTTSDLGKALQDADGLDALNVSQLLVRRKNNCRLLPPIRSMECSCHERLKNKTRVG